MKSKLNDLPGSDNKEFWDGAQYSMSGSRAHSIEDCRHRFEYKDGRVICRFCSYGGFYSGANKEITLKNGKKYKIFGLSS